MRTVRRLYFYIVAFISLQVILWGLITLVSSIFDAPVGGGLANLLARGLSQILVGLPILLIHWRVIQKDLEQDPQEHHSLIRAIFTYGLRLATLAPILTSLHAVLRRPLLAWFEAVPPGSNFLASSSFAENVITIFINLLFFYFALRLQKIDWQAYPQANSLWDVRRLYRIIWLVIAIGTLVVGVQELIFSVLYQSNALGSLNNLKLASGISVTLIATVLWAIMTRETEEAAARDQNEQKNLLRTVFLFGATLSGIAVVLSLGGVIFNDVLHWVFGENSTLRSFINNHSSLLASMLPFGVIWAYYGRNRKMHIQAEDNRLRQAGLHRLFRSILALAGNVLVFIGTWILLSLIAETVWQRSAVLNSMRDQLASGLTLLAIGIPLWVRTWPQLQREAVQSDESGDHARQSVIRKAFLYLLVFASVVGLMAAVGWLAYRLINAALGNFILELGLFSFKQILLIGLIALWLIYHLSTLRRDGRAAHRSLQAQHAAYQTIIISDPDHQASMQRLQQMIQKELPNLPIELSAIDELPALDLVSSASALVMPAALALNQPATLKSLLQNFTGRTILLPFASDPVIWTASILKEEDVFHSTVQYLQQGAEGQEFKASDRANAWSIVGYIAAAIVGLEILFFLVALASNIVMN